MMNHLCLVCEQLATRVCVHPNCHKIPFVCANDCKYGYQMAVLIHTHDNQTKFLPYNQITAKIQRIKSAVPPKQQANDLKKRILRVIGDLNGLIERIDKQIGAQEMVLKKDIAETFNTLNGEKQKNNGKMLHEFMESKSFWEEGKYNEQRTGKYRLEVEELLKKLEVIKIHQVLIPAPPAKKPAKKSN